MSAWLWPGDWRLDLAVLALAAVLDALFPEPPMLLHPVAWMGRLTKLLTAVAPRKGRVAALLAGAAIAAVVPLLFATAAGWAAFGLRHAGWPAYLLGGAVLLKSAFAVTGLTRSAVQVADPLAEGQLPLARERLSGLVGRDTAALTPPQVASAVVESVAENTTDSFIGPWLAFALLGLPGAFAYRAINTLDSMIGHRGRFEYLGKASARLDDLVNLVPARLAAAAMVAMGALVRLPARRAWRVMAVEHSRTASPNAGWTMAAMAGLLGVALEKPGHYRLGEEFRQPHEVDILRSIRVAYLAGALGLAMAGALIVVRAYLVA